MGSNAHPHPGEGNDATILHQPALSHRFLGQGPRPLITAECQPRLYDYIGGTIRGLGGISLGVGGMADHVHVLAKLRPDKALSEVLRELKANASGWLHEIFPEVKDFAWQNGYGAFTVSASQLEKVQSYLARQNEHHQGRTFKDEFIHLLTANGIEYDERYL